METQTNTEKRRVLLLETDERPGLVAALAAECAAQNVSLEITTGPEHVLITFTADDARVDSLTVALRNVPGVTGVSPYRVFTLARV
ncbi:MAG: hypothetical protein ABIY70_01605 [Capsulimonas sp.]|uniref:hypothetical protein n=1 Tax=Capsulimonas sp. TaxID=2494211 RepID=UPI0032650C86